MSALLWISFSSIMAAVGFSRPALAAAARACERVLVRTACMVAMVLSSETFRSPSVRLSQAVQRAVNRSPVPARVSQVIRWIVHSLVHITGLYNAIL